MPVTPAGLAEATVIVLGGIAVGLVAVPMLLFALAFGGCLVPHGHDFDPGNWQRADGESPCDARYGMTDDLTANHLPEGPARSEVLALLSEGEDAEALRSAVAARETWSTRRLASSTANGSPFDLMPTIGSSRFVRCPTDRFLRRSPNRPAGAAFAGS